MAAKERWQRLARPPLRPEERRDDRLPNLRVTAAERALIEGKAAAAGLTLVEYCRRAIFKSRIAPKRGSTDQTLLVELNRVGTNLNQIARRVNAGRDLPPDFPDVLAEVREAVRKVLAHGS
jgi:Mobilization protein NikA